MCIHKQILGKIEIIIITSLIRNVKLFPKEQKEFIFVYEEDYVLQKIKKSHIVLIESIAECHKCRVISKIGVYEIRGDLSVLETQMPDNFVRCRRNCLINLDYVEHIDRSNRIVQLQSKYYSYDAVREDDILNY